MANKIKDALNHIQADAEQKESTKRFLSEGRRKGMRSIHRPAVRWALAVVSLLFFLSAGTGGYFWIQMPVSYLSIDVNPSIELALNRFNKVVSVTAYNEEGEAVVNGLSLKGKEYTEAIGLVMESDTMRVYLTDQQDVVFTLAADYSRGRELEKGVERCSGHMEHGCRHVSVDMTVASEAHAHGLSLGKYNAYLQLRQYDDGVTAEECQDMSIAEIDQLIRECEQNGEHHSETEHGGSDEVEKEDTSSFYKEDHYRKRHHGHGGNHE